MKKKPPNQSSANKNDIKTKKLNENTKKNISKILYPILLHVFFSINSIFILFSIFKINNENF